MKSRALADFMNGKLPLAIAANERTPDLRSINLNLRLSVDSFLDARLAMKTNGIATILPDFLISKNDAGNFLRLDIPGTNDTRLIYGLASNPRLLRLNRHATRMRDLLTEALLS